MVRAGRESKPRLLGSLLPRLSSWHGSCMCAVRVALRKLAGPRLGACWGPYAKDARHSSSFGCDIRRGQLVRLQPVRRRSCRCSAPPASPPIGPAHLTAHRAALSCPLQIGGISFVMIAKALGVQKAGGAEEAAAPAPASTKDSKKKKK